MTGDSFKTHLNAFFSRICVRFYSLFHGVKDEVLFVSAGGKQYSDNPRAISEKLHELFPEHRIKWFLNSKADASCVPDYVELIRSTDDRYALYKAAATAFCFVTCNQITPFFIKRKKQLFIQTWHGDIGMKKILYDAWDGKGKPFPIIDGKVTDIAVSGSKLSENKFRSAFRYNGEVLKCGTPRNDKLIKRDPEEEKKTKRKLGIKDGVKVLLYAPTFRDNESGEQKVGPDLKKVMELLEKKGGEWVCLIRAHAASKGLSFGYDGERFINASSYPDMSDLLAITDMLITDYSSCAGDLIRCSRPVILALFDKEEYTSTNRELYYDPEEAGFITAYSQEELENIIGTYSDSDYAASCEKLMKRFEVCEPGNAAETVCGRIDEFYKKTFKA